MAHEKNHDYHILPPSTWPLLSSIAGCVMLVGGVFWMHDVTPFVFLGGLVAVLYCMFGWWSEVVAESHVGDHTNVVRIGLRYGFILFIMSEVMFFVAWFWSFFKQALYPMYEYVGSEYVQPEIHAVDAFHLPLINTLILLLSGCAVTWAHHALVHENNRKDLIAGLSIAIVLGMLFTASTVALAFALGTNALLSTELVIASLLAIVPSLIGMWAGQNLRRRLSETQFRGTLSIGIVLLGIYIFISASRL